MFVDLVGSTALSARLDPEEMREVLRAYQDAVAGEIARFEGHVAKFMGDGVLAYFGWPAGARGRRRAGGAGRARDRRRRSAALPRRGRRAARGPGRHRDRPGGGRRPDRRGRGAGGGGGRRDARTSPPGCRRWPSPATVVIAERTRRLLGGLFELARPGPPRLKGFAEPVRAWRVGGERPRRGPLRGAARPAALTPLVGREQELALLLDRWARARDGEGQVVLLSGEPGIGKSRLVRALRERLADEPHTRAPLPVLALPHRQRALAGDRAARARRRLRAATTRPRPSSTSSRRCSRQATATTSATAVPLVADAARRSRPGDRYPPPDLSPQQRKASARSSVLLDQLAGLAARRPVLRCSRTRTGSTRPRWSCSTSCSSGCARCRCCCWSPSGRSTAALGRPRRTSRGSR